MAPEGAATATARGVTHHPDAYSEREIAHQIIEQGGDDILALKENQETLHNDIVGP